MGPERVWFGSKNPKLNPFIFFSKKLGQDCRKLRRSVGQPISRACNNISIFWKFINFEISILKIDTFEVKIEKCIENEKNDQVVTHAN